MKKALRNVELVTAIVCASVVATGRAQSPVAVPPADTILTHGEIYKADGAWAEALAIRRGVIVAVGDHASMQSLHGPLTHVIDLKGRTVLPGFHDMHIHPLGPEYGRKLGERCVQE